MPDFNQNILTVQNLNCIRGERDLFSKLNFTLSSGQLLQIEGANGGGKTSLLRIIVGLSAIDEGDILWNNIQIDKTNFKESLVYLGHQTGIKNELTAVENLEFFRQMNNNNQSDLFEILSILSLSGFEDIPCFHLSAGQKRRVGLARLLVSDCPLWVLDEPFTALDKSGVLLFENLCQSHLNKGGMILFTTHQPLQILSSDVLDLSNFRVN